MSMPSESFTSPKGTLSWVFITGQGKTNLQNKQEYTATVTVPLDQGQEFMDQIDEFWEENKPKGAKAPKSTGYKVNGDEVSFTMKTSTTYQDGKAKEITLYNGKAKQIDMPEGLRIGNGSVGALAGSMAIYDASTVNRGVTLYLSAIQLSKYVAFKGRDPGFAADDDADFDGFDEDSDNPFED